MQTECRSPVASVDDDASVDIALSADAEPGKLTDDEAKPKKRRSRQNFSWRQISVLEQVFETDPLPRQALVAELAQRLNITPRCVQVWFQNRRQKWKNMHQAMGQDPPVLKNSSSRLTSLEKLLPDLAPMEGPNGGAIDAMGALPGVTMRPATSMPGAAYSNGAAPGCSCCASSGVVAAMGSNGGMAAAPCGGASAAGQPAALSSASTGLLQPAFLVGMQGAQPVFMLGPPEGRAACGGAAALGGGQFMRLANGAIMKVSPNGYAAQYMPHSYVHCAPGGPCASSAPPALESGAGEPTLAPFPPKGDWQKRPPHEAADALALLTGAAHTAASAPRLTLA